MCVDDLQRQLTEHMRKEPRCLKRRGFIVLNKRNEAWLSWSFRRAELHRQIEQLKSKHEVIA